MMPRGPVTSNLPPAVGELLRLAGVPPSNRKAVAWLNDAIDQARSRYRVAKQRPLPADHNALLVDIDKSAKKLTKQIARLRLHPVPWYAFWRSSVFGPVHHNRVEVPDVFSTLEKLAKAASSAKDDSKGGRRRETGKQYVVDTALSFFVRFSAHTPSGNPTGAFATFAREFYSVATGLDPEESGAGIDRQITQATTRRRAQRNSVK